MLISAKNVTKYHADKCIVDDISFNIEDQSKIGILGVNGTGKSTLLNILVDRVVEAGEFVFKKELKIAYLRQNDNFNYDLTIQKQLATSLTTAVKQYEINSWLTKFGLNEQNVKLNTLSGGQLKRLALIITLLQPFDLLILDEPTNHLDNEMIEYLEKYLIKLNKAIILVTHDRYFLEHIVQEIWEIEQTKLYQYSGNYSQYVNEKAKRKEQDLLIQAKRKKFLKKELEWVNASPQARSTKQKSRLQQFEKLSQIDDLTEDKNLKMINVASRLGKKTIEINNISKSYEQLLFQPFNYLFKRYDRIGIIGHNGVGKSTLLNIISKDLSPDTGEVVYGDTIKIGYFKQGINDLPFNKTVMEYISDQSSLISLNDGQITARNLLEQFLFDKKLQYTLISRLSGGQKRRLYLLSVLLNKPNVLLLDEPTNDLDIQTLQILEDYLDEYPGIVITVSHDRYFLDRICTGLFIINQQKITYANGGYSQNIQLSKTNEKEKPVVKKEVVEKVKLSYLEKKELSQMEDLIASIEEEIKLIDQKINQEQDYQLLNDLTLQRNVLEEKLESKNLRFLELLEKEELANAN